VMKKRLWESRSTPTFRYHVEIEIKEEEILETTEMH
jgi:hypothetical protein